MGTGLLAKGGRGGEAPPLREDWFVRVATIDRLKRGAKVRVDAMVYCLIFLYVVVAIALVVDGGMLFNVST